jgi:acyl-ACP thioesterase
VFERERVVRISEVDASGRLRLDALADHLQQVAEDDAADAGLGEGVGWFVRRCEVSIRRMPRLAEEMRLRTFCSATGPRWAERSTLLEAPAGGQVAARALWVAVDASTGRPTQLSPRFFAVYGASAAGRRVSARLRHPAPASGSAERPWPMRLTDFDGWGHANNVVVWSAVEEVLPGGHTPVSAEIEYHEQLRPGGAPTLMHRSSGARTDLWLVDEGQVMASARVETEPSGDPAEPGGG